MHRETTKTNQTNQRLSQMAPQHMTVTTMATHGGTSDFKCCNRLRSYTQYSCQVNMTTTSGWRLKFCGCSYLRCLRFEYWTITRIQWCHAQSESCNPRFFFWKIQLMHVASQTLRLHCASQSRGCENQDLYRDFHQSPLSLNARQDWRVYIFDYAWPSTALSMGVPSSNQQIIRTPSAASGCPVENTANVTYQHAHFAPSKAPHFGVGPSSPAMAKLLVAKIWISHCITEHWTLHQAWDPSPLNSSRPAE